jgi:DNA helicase-2/ATP-dependent DNA helicase PcrA
MPKLIPVNEILSQLNIAQRQAVEAVQGPVMVIAGAGSGKTRVLTYRVAHLINLGIDPFQILALTFTNKAAREMKERIVQLVGGHEAANVWMGTFHSIFARILRVEGIRLGFPSNFTIYDTDDSKRLIKTIVTEVGLDPKIYAAGFVLGRISNAKSSLVSAAEYNANTEILYSDKAMNRPDIGKLYSLYQSRLFKAQAMDFDDLLFFMNVILRDFPEVLYKYQDRFRFIMVDEYQDTNFAQYLILKRLASRFENICVVGDDAQSIYGFRGANIQNILNFKNDYPEYTLYKLEQNYRSTQVIVNAANSLIAHNKEQIQKKVWTENEDGDKIKVLRAASDNEEGALVANAIFETKMNRQLRNDAFAILYRTNAQSRAIEEGLRKINIPYRVYGGLSFYKRKEIKDILAYFRLVVNHSDEDALRRVINYPARGIGDTTVEKAIVKASETGKTLWEVFESPAEADLDLRSNVLEKISAFIYMIKSFTVQLKVRNAYELARQITGASGIVKNLEEDKSPEGVARKQNIDELLNAINDFTESDEVIPGLDEEHSAIRTLDMFMQDIALLTDADQDDEDTDKVTLMTIHSAKGLEFPYVFAVGLEENLFPNIQALGNRADLEEERRLFYVAITRAEKKLFLSYAESRYLHGNLNFCEPSRFLEEIDESFIETTRKVSWNNAPFTKTPIVPKAKPFAPKAPIAEKPSPSNLTKVDATGPVLQNAAAEELIALLQTGMEVEHERFGRGKVIAMEGAGANKKATVFFQAVGQKQLLLKFAKLRMLE